MPGIRLITPRMRAEIISLKVQGWTYQHIADKFDVSSSAVVRSILTQKDRDKLVKQANGRCEGCGLEAAKLTVHHEDYATDAIRILCASCHSKHTIQHQQPSPRKGKYGVKRARLPAWFTTAVQGAPSLERRKTLGRYIAWYISANGTSPKIKAITAALDYSNTDRAWSDVSWLVGAGVLRGYESAGKAFVFTPEGISFVGRSKHP